MTKILGPQKVGSSDHFQTPPEGVRILIPYINNSWKILEPCYGQGLLFNELVRNGFNVVGSDIMDGTDFLEIVPEEFDCIITNPPYSKKDEILKRCYELGKPFALLLPLTALEGKRRQELYRKYGIQLIIPNKRINFITPSGKGSGSWFQTAWFCSGFNLPNQINFVEADW